MLKDKKWMKPAVILTAICLLAASIFMLNSFNQKELDTESKTQVSKQIDTPDNTEVAYTVVSKYPVSYSMDELIEESTLVIQGTVTSISEPFLIRGIGDIGDLPFTDYTITINQALRGENDNTSVIVRTEGDPADPTVIYEDDPTLELGNEYLLFLKKSDMGGSFNTEGDYYYIIGLKQGVYEKLQDVEALSTYSKKVELKNHDYFINQEILAEEEPNKLVKQIETLQKSNEFQQENGVTEGLVDIRALENFIETAESQYPVDTDFSRKEAESNLKINLENEIISQEEYDELIKNLDVYAEIIK